MLASTRNQQRLANRCLLESNKSGTRHPVSLANSKKNKTTQINAGLNEEDHGQCFATPRIAKINTCLFNNSEEVGRTRRLSAKQTNKSIEQLVQENWNLKLHNNVLSEELLKLKGKTQAKTKWMEDKTKQIDLEFEKQLYWGGSKTYLISGIKFQYQKLKKSTYMFIKEFEEQEQKMITLKRQSYSSKVPEMKAQIDILQQDNKRLSNKLKAITEETKAKYNLNGVNVDSVKKMSETVLLDLENKKKMEEGQQNEMDMKIEEFENRIDSKNKKIQFLQKLILQKDNKEFHNSRKVKNMEKTIADLKQHLKLANDDLTSINNVHCAQIEEIKKKFEAKKKEIFNCADNEIQDLKNKNIYLFEENKQLKNSLNNIKMNLSGRKVERRKSSQSSNNSFVMNKLDSIGPLLNKIGSINSPVSPHKEPINLKHQQFSQFESESQTEYQNFGNEANRFMQTADKKYSDEAIKRRKVSHLQVSEIGEIIKYRLIKSKITGEQMKKYFIRRKNQKSPQRTSESEDQARQNLEWQDEYTNMSEVKVILKSYPFLLAQKQATLLARYIIEDCDDDFVYQDLKNENKRQIVKSILKALVGDFKLCTETQEKQLEIFKARYLPNLISTLKIYNPNGKTSKNKLLEILKDLQVQISHQSIEVLISKTVQDAQSLDELNYCKLSEN